MSTTSHERLEIRIQPDIKKLAERAAVSAGSTLTDLVTQLIREHAPAIIEKKKNITLSNAQYDNFLAICNDKTEKPSQSLSDVAKRLDSEGY
jgi:uncharacterized protein (DUF1778 family)